MSCILFYSPFNQRSRDTESLMIAFYKQGHRVISLSQQEGHTINDFLRSKGIETHSRVVAGKRAGWWYFLRHLFFFVRFCWSERVDIVYSHLEPANFVASAGQYLVRSRTFICRHHIDEGAMYKFDRDLYYRITYQMARNIIVVSDRARNYMIEREGIAPKKITHIDLAYDFGLYDEPDAGKVDAIRAQFSAEILLLTVCRLTPYKRPELAIEVTRHIADRGHDVKLIILGQGETLGRLQTLIGELGLQGRVFMPGYVSNVLEFMAATDFFLHPSLLDSSSVAIKEAGLVKLPVIVCRGIGDFDGYLVHGRNGFLADPDKFVGESAEIIVQNFRNKVFLRGLGENLRRDVLERFSIQNVLHRYDSLNRLNGN